MFMIIIWRKSVAIIHIPQRGWGPPFTHTPRKWSVLSVQFVTISWHTMWTLEGLPAFLPALPQLVIQVQLRQVLCFWDCFKFTLVLFAGGSHPSCCTPALQAFNVGFLCSRAPSSDGDLWVWEVGQANRDTASGHLPVYCNILHVNLDLSVTAWVIHCIEKRSLQRQQMLNKCVCRTESLPGIWLATQLPPSYPWVWLAIRPVRGGT